MRSPHTREALERLAQPTGDRLHGREGAALAQLALELATEVADAEVGAIRDLERASLRAAKRAACMFRAWRSKAPQRGSRETQRGELVVGEDSLGMTAAALTTVPATVR